MTEPSKAITGLVVLLTVCGAVAEPVAAEPSERDEPERVALRQARQHMERGQELYLQGRFSEAAAAFQRAFEAQPHTAFLYNAGVALERAGKPAEAADQLARYLERDPSAPDAASVRQRVERLRTEALAAGEEAAPEGAAGVDPPKTDEDASHAPEDQGTTTPAHPASPDEPPDDGVADPGAAGATGEAPSGDAADPDGSSDPPSAGGDVADPQAPTEGMAADGETAAAAGRARPAAGAPPRAGPFPEAEALEMKSLVRVEADPTNARVSLRSGDEELSSGGAPFTQTLAPGDYRIVIEHPDHESISRDIAVRQGVVYMLIADLRQGQFMGYLTVVSDPPGGQVYLDDRAQGAFGVTPYQAPIPTGSHRVWIERPGYEPVERSVEVGEGEQETVRVELERVSYGRLRVVANVKDARVWIEDRPVGGVPFEGDVPAGTHRVRVEADGVKEWEQDVEVARGQLTPIAVRLKVAPSRGGAWATAVLGAVFIGGGVALGLAANNIEDDLERDANLGRLGSDDDRAFKGRVLSIAGDASLALGGLMAILSVYYFVRDPLPDSEASVLEPRDWAVVPAVGVDGAAAGVRWHF